jgi:peptidoglycan hydrolase CwlO-like protein
MGDAQKWMGEELWKLKEKVDDLPGIISETKDGQTATQEEIDKLRDEVKGLYVELSTVKQQIEASKTDVQAVNQNLTSFRNSSGIFLAVVLVMAFITMVTTLLRR